jgi:Xaa-Pro aminopeptidase
MVLSLETPYYAYGLGALNIEDTVHITPDGPRLLTSLPKSWDV